jgi:Carboxypeptidase regulatory-like domain
MCHARTSLLAVVFSRLLQAHTPTATLVGNIADSSRATVGGATIQVREVSTNETRTVQSQATGEYTVTNLAPGTYEVTIDKPGFRRLRESNLQLQVGQTARLDAQLQLGAVAETIEVKADVPLVNTETATRGDVITTRNH